MALMPLTIEVEREEYGRWLADIRALPGAMAYGTTREQAIAAVKVLALRIIADEIEHGERSPEAADTIFALAA
jgi:predicted RNase H-like HicB family nuclease